MGSPQKPDTQGCAVAIQEVDSPERSGDMKLSLRMPVASRTVTGAVRRPGRYTASATRPRRAPTTSVRRTAARRPARKASTIVAAMTATSMIVPCT
ncbi:Uncharacterised protein [Mycobacteroides abscessus]|nr:Uncharacterised protein [Mycobacteroides abscessus]